MPKSPPLTPAEEDLRLLFEHDMLTVPGPRRTPSEASFKRAPTGRYNRSDIEQLFEVFARGYRVGRGSLGKEG